MLTLRMRLKLRKWPKWLRYKCACYGALHYALFVGLVASRLLSQKAVRLYPAFEVFSVWSQDGIFIPQICVHPLTICVVSMYVAWVCCSQIVQRNFTSSVFGRWKYHWFPCARRKLWHTCNFMASSSLIDIPQIFTSLQTVKEAAIADMEKAKQRDGLEWVEVSLKWLAYQCDNCGSDGMLLQDTAGVSASLVTTQQTTL